MPCAATQSAHWYVNHSHRIDKSRAICNLLCACSLSLATTRLVQCARGVRSEAISGRRLARSVLNRQPQLWRSKMSFDRRLALLCTVFASRTRAMAADPDAEGTPTPEVGGIAHPKSTGVRPPKPEAAAPFAFADFSWVPGNAGASEKPFSFGPFTGELRVDTVYHWSFNNPQDDTISGSSEVFRHAEFQVTQL